MGNTCLNNSKQILCDRTSQSLKYADMHGVSLRKGYRGDVFRTKPFLICKETLLLKGGPLVLSKIIQDSVFPKLTAIQKGQERGKAGDRRWIRELWP